MNLEMSITNLFTQITNNFRYNFELKMNELNLHSGQVFILISLWKNDGQSQIELANNLNLSAPTINKMVKSLSENGFIECFKCTTDGRIMRVKLTQKGIDSQRFVTEKCTEFETAFFSNLNDTEKLILTQIFDKLKINIKSEQDKV